ncbi:hypothetical protein B1M_03112 [Burkholderia sp. TJI49]|nr:hypothetical protein B1M_03112 [Burkholderia sp. TJI49]
MVKGLTVWLVPLAAVLVLGWLTRGAYHAPGRLATTLKAVGALAGAVAAVGMQPVSLSRRDGALACQILNVALGAMAGYVIVSLSLDLLARQTATQARVELVSYDLTGGWKNCRYGVAFDDDALQARLTLCGPRVGVPQRPDTGTQRLTETVGPYGMVLNSTEVEMHR